MIVMVDDTHDLMSSSWPHACLPDGTVPGGHSDLVLFFSPSFVYIYIKIHVVSETCACHHSLRISDRVNIIDTVPLDFYLTFLSCLTSI